MASKTTKAILAKLKGAGITVDDLAKVEERLDELELDPAEFLGDGQVLLSHADYRELKDDLSALRRRAKTAEEERDTYKEAHESGDNLLKSKSDRLQKRVDELEPVFKELEAQWVAASASIPDTLKGRFAFGDQNTPLSTDQVLQNVNKLREYRELGVINAAAATPQAPQTPAGPAGPAGPSVPTPQIPSKPDGKGFTQEQLAQMPSSAKIEAGYGRPQ